MGKATVIAIDGPAGSGKSTLGLALAARLGFLYFDTGVLYRAVAWLALERGLDVREATALVRLAEQNQPDVAPATLADGRSCTVTIAGCDVTWAIREPRVDASVSLVAAHPALRRALICRQREIAGRGRVVMVGRDIGTVVAPGADLKIYLDASPEVRAERRFAELRARGIGVARAEVEAELRRRDKIDSGRAAAPLRAAPDAVIIKSDGLSVEQEVESVLALLAEKEGSH